MPVLKAVASACAVAVATMICAPGALAQTPAPSAPPVAAPLPPGPKLVLLPYEAPGNKDPHAGDLTAELSADLIAAGIPVVTVAPVNHLDAVADAAKVCADNGATGILVPEGRYEQTHKVIPTPFLAIQRYPTHVEMRLDDVGCDGIVRWTTTKMGDTAATGVISVGNLGSYVDAAFRIAVEAAATARGAATIAPAAVPAGAVAIAAPAAAAPATIGSYLLLPIEEPGIAEPRGPDMSNSLLTQLHGRKLDVKMGTAIDHVTAVATAAQLCTSSGAQAIIVPNVRVEQSSFDGRSHASVRLALLSCGGRVIGHGLGEADMGSAFAFNFGAAVVGVAERAMVPAIDQLFPSNPAPAPSPSPAS